MWARLRSAVEGQDSSDDVLLRLEVGSLLQESRLHRAGVRTENPGANGGGYFCDSVLRGAQALPWLLLQTMATSAMRLRLHPPDHGYIAEEGEELRALWLEVQQFMASIVSQTHSSTALPSHCDVREGTATLLSALATAPPVGALAMVHTQLPSGREKCGEEAGRRGESVK